MSKQRRKKVKFRESGFYHDDCPICREVAQMEEKTGEYGFVVEDDYTEGVDTVR